MKYCILDERRTCNACGECEKCDLDSTKICNNCCACIDGKGEADAAYDLGEDGFSRDGFAKIEVVDIVTEQSEEYLDAFFMQEAEDEMDGEFACSQLEQPDANLIAYWEEQLRKTARSMHAETLQRNLHAVRKRKERH